MFLAAVAWLLAASLLGRAQTNGADLIRFLSDPSFKVRLQAAIQIGKQRIHSGRSALRRALDDDHDLVRAAAALSLGQLGDQDARPILVKLLDHQKRLIRRSAEKSLSLLDRANGTPRHLVAIAKPALAKGVRRSYAKRLLRKVTTKLKRVPQLVLSAGEERVLKDKRLAGHLSRRKLAGRVIRPRIVHLSTREIGGSLTILCRVSLMTVSMVTHRIEFASEGEAAAEVEQRGLDADQLADIQIQVLDASIEAAAEQLIDRLARRAAPGARPRRDPNVQLDEGESGSGPDGATW